MLHDTQLRRKLASGELSYNFKPPLTIWNVSNTVIMFCSSWLSYDRCTNEDAGKDTLSELIKVLIQILDTQSDCTPASIVQLLMLWYHR